MPINLTGNGVEERPAPSMPWLVLYLLAYLFAAHLQVALGTGRPGDYGWDLALILTATLGMIHGPEIGMRFGCLGGLFHDLAIGSSAIGLFAITGLIAGYLAGVLSEWTVRSRWGVAGALIALLGLGQAILAHLLLWMGGTGVPWPTWMVVGRGLFYNGILGAFTYALLGRLTGGRWF